MLEIQIEIAGGCWVPVDPTRYKMMPDDCDPLEWMARTWPDMTFRLVYRKGN